MQLTRNFHIDEFASGGPDGPKTVPVPPHLWPNVQELANNLQTIRDAYGPLSINSGYRTPEHNKRSKGSSTSQHLHAKAADLPAAKPEKLFHLIISLMNEGKIKRGGLGLYDWGVHYDVRDTQAFWDYRKKKA